MIHLKPEDLSIPDLQRTLQFAVGPRPIALASTVDRDGRVNLSPFSFFNVFSTNPPILIFSPANRGRDGSTKDTLNNVMAVPQVVIHSVSHSMVEQTSLSSTEYETGVNEFVKAGFTAIPSELVQPPRVAEAPVAMECDVLEVKPLGDGPGAGNLVICEVKLIHIHGRVLDEEGRLDQDELDLVGRLGGDWYVRANGDALFEVEKPISSKGIGVDALPPSIRNSTILSGNDLGRLGNVEMVPTEDEVQEYATHRRIREIFDRSTDRIERREDLHMYAKEALEVNKVKKAWKILLTDRLNAPKGSANL
ncbi:MAG: flavin reductase family protein [Schleiferiaceae bacterium]|nr:flavin reductase family protein [Schleiferiaceae bacterium]